MAHHGVEDVLGAADVDGPGDLGGLGDLGRDETGQVDHDVLVADGPLHGVGVADVGPEDVGGAPSPAEVGLAGHIQLAHVVTLEAQLRHHARTYVAERPCDQHLHGKALCTRHGPTDRGQMDSTSWFH